MLALQLPAQHAVQRKYQRYVFSESLTIIRKLAPSDTRRYPGIATEISEGGMSAIVTEPLNVGDEVQLSFDLKRKSPDSVRVCLVKYRIRGERSCRLKDKRRKGSIDATLYPLIRQWHNS